MRPLVPFALASVSAALLCGCASASLVHSKTPDEFAVQRQAPLIVPPDFALTPPKQGQPRATDQNLQQQTLDALFGGAAPRSPVESDAISRAGDAVPGIRSTAGDLATYTVAKGAITRDILAAPQGDGREAQTAIPTG